MAPPGPLDKRWRARGELTSDGLLPLVLPLVVYNGDKRWWAPRELSELEQVEPGAEIYIPRLRYRVIDKGDYDAKDLERRGSLTALLLWLEKHRNPQALKRVVPRLTTTLLSRTEDLPLSQAFMAWLNLMLDPEETKAIPELRNLEEFRDMLQDAIETWRRQLRGQGERAGEAKVLLRLLEQKFGPLDSKTRARVRKAGSRRLLEWADRFVTADRLEDVFGTESAEPQPS